MDIISWIKTTLSKYNSNNTHDKNAIYFVKNEDGKTGKIISDEVVYGNGGDANGIVVESPKQPTGGESVWVNPDEDPEEVEIYNRGQVDALLNTKQNELTLTVKDNGNIVIGNIKGQTKEFMPATPSGDPMHYAYVAAGAEYNENTGFWKIGSVDDITNNEIREAYIIRPAFFDSNFNGVYSHIRSRVIFPMRIYGGGNTFSNKLVLFYDSPNLIEIPETVNKKDFYYSGEATLLFANDRKLKYIRMTMIFEKVTNTQNSFAGCISLEEVLIKTYSSLYFNDCSKLSIESVLYMINNEAATSPITITLHADAYARAMANADIVAALEAHPNVSLASA